MKDSSTWLAAGWLATLALVRLWPDTIVAANALHSDAPDYALSALSFCAGNGFVLPLGGSVYPPYHMFGFPLLLVPAYQWLGEAIGNGVYPVFVAAMAVMLMLWRLSRPEGVATAFSACVILLCSDTFQWYSRIIASDIPSTALTMAVVMLAMAGRFGWMTVPLALAILVRPDNVMLALILPLFFRKRACVLGSIIAIACFDAAFLVSNWFYTGDPMRPFWNVLASASRDRPGGFISPAHLLQPSLGTSNLAGIIKESCVGYAAMDRSVPKALVYAGLTLLALWQWSKDGLRWFLAAWFGVAALGLACLFDPNESPRIMVRFAPFWAWFAARGVVALWHKLKMRRLCVAATVVVVCGMFARPFSDRWARLPVTEYLTICRNLIPDNRALIVSNFNPFYAEHYLIRGTDRRLMPWHQYVVGADLCAQWEKPRHPEWITEDQPTAKHVGLTVRYRRQVDNGAVPVWRFYAERDTGVIEDALASGIPVYIVSAGIYNAADMIAAKRVAGLGNVEVMDVYSVPSFVPGKSPERFLLMKLNPI